MVAPEQTLTIGSDDVSVPLTSSASNMNSPRTQDRINFRRPRNTYLCNPCSVLLLFLLFVRLLFAVFNAPNLGVGLLFIFVSLLPAFIVAWFVLTRFRDEIADRSFLLMQFLIGAIPLVLVLVPFEILTTLIAATPIFFSVVDDIKEHAQDIMEAVEKEDFLQVQQIIEKIFQTVPLWTVIITTLLVAYISAGTVEEVGKWLAARRFIGLECICGNDDRRVGCRGIMASACMVALGFATIENIGYVSGMAKASSSTGSVLMFVALGLFRGVVAFPVHVGTQLYVAITAAKKRVFADDVSVFWALVQAILFHGTFDAIAFISMILVGFGSAPAWIGILVPVVDVIMAVLLLLVCRARYKSLLERERMAITVPV